MKYDFKSVEAKWQKVWEDEDTFHVEIDHSKPKFYALVEFPYPSAAGLHVGHPRSYTALDIVARKKRQCGYNVLYPMGWDAFGLPTENYALKNHINPEIVTAQNVARFKSQLKALGLSFDWDREINTTDPEYYKWTQWIFVQLFKKGLAYKKETTVNYCTGCKVVLANEDVVNGVCERCGSPVVQKNKSQWMRKITAYADRLINEIGKDWSRRIVGVALLEATHEIVGTEIDGIAVKANFTDFMDWIRREALDEVYVDVPMDSGESFIPYLEEMESMGLTVHFCLPLLDRIEEACCDETSAARLSRTLGRCAGGSIVTMGTVELKLRDQIAKRCMDIVGGLVGCILSIPIIAIVAIPLKIESPGPLFFKQKRVGRNGRYFYIHKLRSMYMDAEDRKKELMAQNEMNGLMFKMEDDPRVTKVGKFIRKTSIDELPQFFDVLRGDMSLVGTRPPTVDEYKQYESHHKRRLSMKPGITGLWQVSGRSNIEDFEEVVKLDVTYIDNWSLWNDIKILFKTVYVVFAGRGAK